MEIAMVTGPSSGIGAATTIEMARRGFHVIAAGRSEERCMPVVETVRNEGGSAEFLHLDLADLESCRDAAGAFAASKRSLDVLVNNAGVGAGRGLTRQGFEIHFGVNHLGHFLLTQGLAEFMPDDARVVTVSSEMHRRARGIDFGRLRRKPRSLGGYREYSVSKLANILFSRELARRRPNLRTSAVHPGLADTGIFPPYVRPFFRNRRSPAEAAATVVWCATSSDVGGESGRYYARKSPLEPSAHARDDHLARELWERSEAWCAAALDPPGH